VPRDDRLWTKREGPCSGIGIGQSSPRGPRARKTQGQRVRLLLHHDEHCDAHAGVENIEKEIVPVDVVDVDIIGVSPFNRPRIHEHKRVASVDELRLSLDNDRTVDDESVLPAEIGMELFVGDVSTLGGGACVLRSLAGMLRLLFMRRPCLLFPMLSGRFRFALSGRLSLLLPGRFGLVLSWWLGLFPTRFFRSRWFGLVPALFLLLCENSYGTSKQEGQNSGTEKSGSLHIVLRNWFSFFSWARAWSSLHTSIRSTTNRNLFLMPSLRLIDVGGNP